MRFPTKTHKENICWMLRVFVSWYSCSVQEHSYRCYYCITWNIHQKLILQISDQHGQIYVHLCIITMYDICQKISEQWGHKCAHILVASLCINWLAAINWSCGGVCAGEKVHDHTESLSLQLDCRILHTLSWHNCNLWSNQSWAWQMLHKKVLGIYNESPISETVSKKLKSFLEMSLTILKLVSILWTFQPSKKAILKEYGQKQHTSQLMHEPSKNHISLTKQA